MRYLSCALVILTLLPATASAVTEKAEDSLRTKYANAEVQQWQLDSDGNWEVSFAFEGTIYRACFTDEGEWLYTETTIDNGEIPEAIQKAIDSDLKASSIELIEAVDHAEHGKLFEILTNTDGKRKRFQFRESGERFDSLFTPPEPSKEFRIPDH